MHPRSGLRQWMAFRRKLSRRRPQWPRRWRQPGHVRFITPTERGVIVTTDQVTLEITFFAADLVRVGYRPHAHEDVPEPIPYAIAKPLEQWSIPPIVHIQTEKAFLLRSEGDIPGAAAVLETWLLQSSGDADVQYRVGLLLASDDPESALVHLQAAGRSDEETVPPVDQLTRTLRSVLFEDDPAYRQVMIGRALASQGHWDLSVRAFERAVSLAPE